MKQSVMTGHVQGTTYLSGYWLDKYEVLSVNENGWVTVKWAKDGHETTHCTPVGRDKVVTESVPAGA